MKMLGVGYNMQFIIQQNLLNEAQLLLIKKAVEQFPHQFVSLIPFTHEIISDSPIEGIDFIPYGSTLLTTVTKELGWKGLHFDLSQFNYQTAAQYRTDMLNAEHILPLTEAVQFLRAEQLGELWFMRPSEDLKQFSGQVIEAREAADWLEDAATCESSGSYNMSVDTMIVLARPKPIQAEWRWFVIGGRVIDGSMYRAHGQLVKYHEEDQNVIQEAQQVADRWLPTTCCVMDLALIEGEKELKVIEFNCINSSGMYGHNVDKIFEELFKFHH